MRLQELFLVETTEEDRALVSLSSSIYDYIKTYEGDGRDLVLGTIGELFDTPMVGFDDIKLELLSPKSMVERVRESSGNYSEGGIPLGVWNAVDTISFNIDHIQSNRMKTVITHELRHVLDDVKSDFALGGDNRYFTPKKKEFRNTENDPGKARQAYLAEPAEINARFVEVLHAMVPAIRRSAKLPKPQLRAKVMQEFNRALLSKEIAEFFPERTASRDYKRLVKRGVDFIDKEIAHQLG